jgi:hypothetical protein
MKLDQATTVLEHTKNDPPHACVVFSLMTGVRSEETRFAGLTSWHGAPEAKERRPVAKTGFRRKDYAVYVCARLAKTVTQGPGSPTAR